MYAGRHGLAGQNIFPSARLFAAAVNGGEVGWLQCPPPQQRQRATPRFVNKCIWAGKSWLVWGFYNINLLSWGSDGHLKAHQWSRGEGG